MSVALDFAHELPERTLCQAAGVSRSKLRRRLLGTPERPPLAALRVHRTEH